MNARHLSATVLAVLFSWVPSAGAYTTIPHWGTTSVRVRAAQISFPSGNAYRTSLGAMVHRFNHNPSDFRINQTYDDTSVEFDNGQNEVWFTSDAAYDPAVTTWWTDFWTGHMEEADVVFYNGEDYTTSMSKTNLWPFGGPSRPFQTTAMHEYGHVGGLGHEADEYNIMGQDWDHVHCNGTTVTSYLGEDAACGLIAHYTRKDSQDIQDVSASPFKRTGASGEYSAHGLCKMYNTSGTELTSDGYNGQRRYRVNNGQRVRVEFTYENSGETTQTGRVGFYLSSNSTITTADRLITTRTFSLTRDDVVTQYNTITLPSDLTSGTTYYLGVIVDDEGLITEVDESNAAYHIIRVN